VQRVAAWVWADRSFLARMTRLALVPGSLLYRWAAAARVRAHERRWLPTHIPSVPTIAVGNLTVGGSGKTPIASWIAAYYVRQGVRPGVVLRGYGGDEGEVHRQRVPEAIVIEDPDRMAGADAAVAQGAQVVVLDDAYQRLDIGRDLNIAVLSAESARAARWTLPAGPWREPWTALRRADIVVVTRKRATPDAAVAVLRDVRDVVPGVRTAAARLALGGFRRLRSGQDVPSSDLDRARLVVGAGIADPRTFARQCEELGARVRLLPFPDHHAYTARDVRRLLHAAGAVDYVVVTQKDAVKLRHHWPDSGPEPLVALLDVIWEAGRSLVETALDAAASDITGFFAPDENP
jgi:tetraacyldisaccharide 4'-kinase